MIRLGIIGINGRMGQAIARIAKQQANISVAGGVVRHLSEEPEVFSYLVTTKLNDLLPLSDIVIDFGAATATADYVMQAAKAATPFLCGTTGLNDTTKSALDDAARHIPVLYASNTSLSLAVMNHLVKQASSLLADGDFDVAIHDQHHRWKKDAPSGTAKTLGEAVQTGSGGKKIPSYSAVRAGAIIGEHDVIFAGLGETISLHHSVTDRDVFARGAITAALWLYGKAKGRYSINDVLGIPA